MADVVVMVSVAREVGRTGAFTTPDVVAAGEEVETRVLETAVVEREEVVDVRITAGTTVVVVEVAGILEETLYGLVVVGVAVTVGFTMTVLVDASTPSGCRFQLVSRLLNVTVVTTYIQSQHKRIQVYNTRHLRSQDNSDSPVRIAIPDQSTPDPVDNSRRRPGPCL